MKEAISGHLRVLWDYLVLETPLKKADVIIGFGSYNTEVPARAADLWRQGLGEWLLFTGKLGKGTEGVWNTTEAARFGQIALERGVDPGRMLLEENATNTGENIALSRALLESRGILVQSVLAVHKAYMTRRIHASLQKQWPGVEVMVTCPRGSMGSYVASLTAQGVPEEEIICSLVGDFQRMEVYAGCGYQIEVDIPRDAWQAFEALCAMGYTRYVV